jgi:hypothetical protein
MKVRKIGSNQTEVTFSTGAIAFFSYETLVAAFLPGVGYRRTTEYSKTTRRHINQWLEGMNAKEISPAALAAEVEGQIARAVAFGEGK